MWYMYLIHNDNMIGIISVWSIPHVHVCFDLEHKMSYSPHFKSGTKYVFKQFIIN
jgi:hypothetical protein